MIPSVCKACGSATRTLKDGLCSSCAITYATDTGLGLKFDKGKLRYSLIPPTATHAIAEVLTFGAEKYAPNSWQHVPNAHERYLDALMRHLEAYRAGELIDPESLLPHMSHLLCNAAFLSYFDSKDSHDSTSD